MIKSAPYYWIECDNCGSGCESSECSAFADSVDAVDTVMDEDWTCDGVRHHCAKCPTLHRCEGCDAPVDDPDAGERDYLCLECWDRDQALTPTQTGGQP